MSGRHDGGVAEVVAELEADGGKGLTVTVDLTDPDAVGAARDEVDMAVGRAHILVNNVGVYPNQPFEALTVDDWRSIFAVNVDTMFHATQACLPGMKEHGWGRVVFFDVVPQLQAIKRVELPGDLTGTVSFLASDDAAFITGQTFFVDGGLVRA